MADELVVFFQHAYADGPLSHAFADADLVRARWLYMLEAPAAGSARARAWVCRSGGAIVGHIASIPAILALRDGVCDAQWARDLITAPAARGLGAGTLLIKTLVAEAGLALLAGMNPRVQRIYRQLGYIDHGRLPFYVKSYAPHRVLHSLGWPRLVRGAARVGLTVVAASQLRRLPTSDRRVSERVPSEREFDRLWALLEPTLAPTVRRNGATMSWRYQRHPQLRYRIFVAEGADGASGLVVLRHGTSRSLPAGSIVELLADPYDVETCAALLARGEAELKASVPPPTFLRCVVAHRGIAAHLRRAGFLRAPSPIGWMVASRDGRVPDELRHPQRWFLNGGDSDLDMW